MRKSITAALLLLACLTVPVLPVEVRPIVVAPITVRDIEVRDIQSLEATTGETAMSMADAFDWLVNAHANLAGEGPGFFGTISQVQGKPYLYILRLSNGEFPFGTLLLYKDTFNDEILLIAESGYSPMGEVGNIRTFWRKIGDRKYIGIRFLPRWIDRNTPVKYRVNGFVVERAITSWGAPYRPDGTRLSPGENQSSDAIADVTLEHVGVTNQLGEPVAVLRRTDRMGASPQNVEQYEIGFGRGAYGFIRWDSWIRGVYDKGGYSDRIVPVNGGCQAYGVDPLDPELKEQWFATVGYTKQLKQAGPLAIVPPGGVKPPPVPPVIPNDPGVPGDPTAPPIPREEVRRILLEQGERFLESLRAALLDV